MFEARWPSLSSFLSTTTPQSRSTTNARDAAVAGVLVGLGVDRVVVRVAAVGDEALGAVDHVLVALLDGRRAHPRDVGAGVGLGQAERRELRRFGEHAEVLLLDLLRAAERDRRGRQAVAAERGLDARAAPRELLLDQAAVEVAGAGAAVLLLDVGVHQADLPGLLDDVLRPGAVLVVLPGDGADLFLGEVVRHLAQVLLLVGEREIDHSLLSRLRRLTGQSTSRLAEERRAGNRLSRVSSRGRDGRLSRTYNRSMQSAFPIVVFGTVALSVVMSIVLPALQQRQHVRPDRLGRAPRRGRGCPGGGSPFGLTGGDYDTIASPDCKRRARAGNPPDAARAQRTARAPRRARPGRRRRGRPADGRRSPRAADTTRGSPKRSASWWSRATNAANARASSRSTSRPRCSARLAELNHAEPERAVGALSGINAP